MKPLSTILVTTVVVAAGILLYDTVRDDEARVVVEADAPRQTPTGEARLGSTPASRLERRITVLEEQVAAQGREIAVLLQGGATERRDTDPGRPSGLESGPAPPPMRYDEETLASLKTHLLELRRRDRERQIRTQVAGQLQRLDLDLDEIQTKQVVDAAVRYRADSSKRWAEMQQAGMSDPDAMRKEIRPFRGAFIQSIRPVVPAADLDRIVTQLIGGP